MIFDQGLCSIANFYVGVMVARACDKSEYGIFILGLTILRVITGIQNSIISVPYAICYPRCKESDSGEYLGSTYVHQLAACLITGVGFCFFAGVVFWRGDSQNMAFTLLVLALASSAFMLREFVRHIMLAELRFWPNMSMSLVANTVTVVVIYYAYKAEYLDTTKAYLIITMCSGLPALVMTIIYGKKICIIKSKVIQDFKNNFRLGKWIVARSLVNTGAVSLYPFLLTYFFDTAQAGVYGVCIQFSSLLNPIFMGLGSYLRPATSHLAASRPDLLQRYIINVFLWLMLIVFIIYVACIFYGYELLLLVYGQQYTDSKIVLLVCLFGVSVSVLTSPILRYHEALARTDIPFKAGLAGLFMTATLGVVLVAKYGIIGAAVGFSLAHITVFGVNVFMIKGQLRCKF